MIKRYDIVIFILVIMLAVLIWIGFFFFASGNGIVQIVYNGEVLKQYKLGEANEYIYELPDGRKNVIEIGDSAFVKEANCPDKICMQKKIKSGGEAIVCVPNELIIRVR